MFFGDPELLERCLHNDLNSLIKNIKQRDEQYIEIVKYNRAILAENKFDNQLFLN